MFKKSYLYLIILVLPFLETQTLLGQGYAGDIIRYSQTNPGGSTRMISVGGAQTALGGDLGSLSSNPAGLGLFRHSEYGLTLQVPINQTQSNYFGSSLNSSSADFYLNSISAVFTKAVPEAGNIKKTGGWLSYSFGIGASSTADYLSSFSFNGTNPNNSFTNFLSDQANFVGGINFDVNNQAQNNTLGGQAYNAFLLNTNPNFVAGNGQNQFIPVGYPNGTKNHNQSGSLGQFGTQGEINLGFGTNYGNILYLGIGANIASLHYGYNFSFFETGISDPNVSALNYLENYDVTGTGFSAKAGLIFSPINEFRIGAYVQTPTWYSMIENQNESQVIGLDSKGMSISNNQTFLDASQQFSFKTPFRYNLGMAFFAGQSGFITGDVEYLDYSGAKYINPNDPSGDFINGQINTYKSSLNLKLGGEIRLGILGLRAGYGLFGNPKNGSLSTDATSQISGGLGIRTKNGFIDLGIVNITSNSSYQIYPTQPVDGPSPFVDLKSTKTNIFVTIGQSF